MLCKSAAPYYLLFVLADFPSDFRKGLNEFTGCRKDIVVAAAIQTGGRNG
jgi:hypothetical protein